MDYKDFDTRLAAYAVITDDTGRLLLALWNEGSQPRWTMPGGAVELDETTEQAVVREVDEETGYEIEVGALLGVHVGVIAAAERTYKTTRPLKAVRVMYRATIVGGSLRNEVGGTTDEARWFPLDQVGDLPHVSIVDIACDYLAAERR